MMEIQANAFVLHMVRNIARLLVECSDATEAKHAQRILLGRDRTQLGATAPPDGLYLTSVRYPGQDFPPVPEPAFLGATYSASVAGED